MQGIKFNQDGITAILEGRKSMTRRPIKPQPKEEETGYFTWLSQYGLHVQSSWKNLFEEIAEEAKYKIGETVFAYEVMPEERDTKYCKDCAQKRREMSRKTQLNHRYGRDGFYYPVKESIMDRLEYFDKLKCFDFEMNTKDYFKEECKDRDDVKDYISVSENDIKKYSNIFLKITNIKVERLQDISEEDCIAEGIIESYGIIDVKCYGGDPVEIMGNMYGIENNYECPIEAFEKDIWNKLPYQAPYDWNSNPYVFVYEFERIENV